MLLRKIISIQPPYVKVYCIAPFTRGMGGTIHPTPKSPKDTTMKPRPLHTTTQGTPTMKTKLAALLLIAFSSLAYADGCTVHTFLINGVYTTCTTCCYSGSCNTSCY